MLDVNLQQSLDLNRLGNDRTLGDGDNTLSLTLPSQDQPTRKVSPFDESKTGGVQFSSYVPSQNGNSSSTDQKIADLLQQLIALLQGDKQTGQNDSTNKSDGTDKNGSDTKDSQATSKQELLAMMLVLLMMEMGGKGSQGSTSGSGSGSGSTTGTGSGSGSGDSDLSALSDKLKSAAENSGMDPSLVFLLEQILSMLTGNKSSGSEQSSGNGSGSGDSSSNSSVGDDIDKLIDKIFGNSNGSSTLDPDIKKLLKELLTLLQQKQQDSASSTTNGDETSGSENTTSNSSSSTTGDQSISSMVSDLVDNSPATKNLDSDMKTLLKDILTVLFGGKLDQSAGNKTGDGSTGENNDQTKDSGQSDLQSLLTELLQVLTSKLNGTQQ